ncbi:MAG TPA: EamA family transporter [Spirochaetaceae bacterium]|nr:EamA family transporter [Spirochaetaceae bacterium]
MARLSNYLAGIGASVIFGFSFLFSKNALDTLQSHELLFLRFLCAALVMSALVLARIIKVDYRGKDVRPLLATALLQPVLYFIIETEGLRHAESSTAGIILSAIPVTVTVMAAIILKERLRPAQLVTTLLSFSGVVLVVSFRASGKIGGSPLAYLLLILSMLCAASFNILSRKSSRSFKPAEITFFMMWFGAISFGLIFLVKALGAIGSGAPALYTRLTPPALSAVLYLGVLSSVVAFLLVNFNLSKLKSPEAAVFANLTTLVSVIAGLAFRGERLLPSDLVGALMIIGGVWGTNVYGAKPGIAIKRAIVKGKDDSIDGFKK